ncbi:MAG: DUF1415 domain-containing protein [Pirellula sp.]
MSTNEENTFQTKVIAATTAWLEKVVIGLNLCPFAKSIHVKRQIRYSVSFANNSEALREDLKRELTGLVAARPDQIESTLLIHPQVLADFQDYLHFLVDCDATLEELELDGIIQVASFHPHYQFEGTKADDVTNYSNRSPFPTLHLLRESSVTRAVDSFPDTAAIYESNIATLKQIGRARMEEMIASLTAGTASKSGNDA